MRRPLRRQQRLAPLLVSPDQNEGFPQRFTPEVKAEAVALVEAAGGNVARVAKELGIAEFTVGNWVRNCGQATARTRAYAVGALCHPSCGHEARLGNPRPARGAGPLDPGSPEQMIPGLRPGC